MIGWLKWIILGLVCAGVVTSLVEWIIRLVRLKRAAARYLRGAGDIDDLSSALEAAEREPWPQ